MTLIVTLLTTSLLTVSLGLLFSLGARWRRGYQNRWRPPWIGKDEKPALALRLPFGGRWVAANTPGHKVPSHGTHFLAQTYALDFVAVDEDWNTEVRKDWKRHIWLEPPNNFIAFGQPVRAPADACVVASHDRSRDHSAMRSLPARVLSLVLQIRFWWGGLKSLTGNYVVLSLGTNAFALIAHLRQGSLRVRPGDLVKVNEIIAECGNSGNSTQPHIHFQVMDSSNPYKAYGLAVAFQQYERWTSEGGWTAVRQGTPDEGQLIRQCIQNTNHQVDHDGSNLQPCG